MRIPFATQSDVQDSLPAGSERLVNLYAEKMLPGSRTEFLVRHVPGLVPFGFCGDGPVRAADQLGNNAYVVSGTEVYRLSGSGVTLKIGDIELGLPVTMAASAQQVVIVAPPKAWVIENDILTQITDTDFPAVTSVTYLHGYFIFSVADSDQYVISDILNATDYDSLDFSSAEAVPDNILRVMEVRQELWLFCSRSIEIHQDTGAALFPFQRQSGGVIDLGTGAQMSPAKVDNTVIWMGDDGIVYRALGYQPQRVSTHAVEKSIAAMTNPGDGIGMPIKYAGHEIYSLTFVSGNRTFLYDASTNRWFERASILGARWRANCGFRLGRHMLIGDANSGVVFRMEQSVATENSEGITAQAQFPILLNEGKRAFLDHLEVECEAGGNNPAGNLNLSWSDDGGFAFNTPIPRSLGTPGDRKHRLYWDRLGSFRERVIRLTGDPGMKLALYNADVRLRGGGA